MARSLFSRLPSYFIFYTFLDIYNKVSHGKGNRKTNKRIRTSYI